MFRVNPSGIREGDAWTEAESRSGSLWAHEWFQDPFERSAPLEGCGADIDAHLERSPVPRSNPGGELLDMALNRALHLDGHMRAMFIEEHEQRTVTSGVRTTAGLRPTRYEMPCCPGLCQIANDARAAQNLESLNEGLARPKSTCTRELLVSYPSPTDQKAVNSRGLREFWGG